MTWRYGNERWWRTNVVRFGSRPCSRAKIDTDPRFLISGVPTVESVRNGGQIRWAGSARPSGRSKPVPCGGVARSNTDAERPLKTLILYQFRKHLADQIRNYPVEPKAAAESYAITTAALARKILDYLNARDLTLPNGFKRLPDSPPYKLGTVLDRIIHFRTFGQDAISFNHPGKPDLVTLYSDKHMRFKGTCTSD